MSSTVWLNSLLACEPERGDTRGMGFNPYRPQRRRTSDYLFVAAAFVVTAALVLWAVL